MNDSDTPAYETQYETSASRLLFMVDHASRYIPPEYDSLGLEDTSVLHRHIAWDIGIEDVTRRLADRLKATAIYARFSRLLLDPNRYPTDPASTPVVSDGVEVPANRHVDETERKKRLSTWFEPYHTAATSLIDAKSALHGTPLLFAMHSFTPVMNEFERPWHIGVLWDRDNRIAAPLLEILKENSSLVVGDNEPYSAREPMGYSMNEHGTERNVPHVAIEIRQDLIDTRQGAEKWASIMADAIMRLCQRPEFQGADKA